VPVLREGKVAAGQSRRALLTGLAGLAAGAALAGCWPLSKKPDAHPSPHPLTPVVAGTVALVDRYQATIAAVPSLAGRLQPLVADHRAHLDALRSAMGLASPSPTPSGAASPSTSVAPDPAAALAALRTAEQAAQADAGRACLAAAAEHAALVGSIAACRATHVEVLFS
jgi:hypothetical protein